MSANGISTLTTKKARQKAKLDIAQAKRQGKTVAVDGTITGNVDPTKPYYRNDNIYDITLLPTQYSGNNIVDNNNNGGLQTGRPWEVLALESNLLVDLSTANDASYPGTGTAWNDVSGNTNNFTLYNSPTYTQAEPGYFTFNPSNAQYAEAATLGSLTQWTVEAWFRTSADLSAAGPTGATALVTTTYQEGSNFYNAINFCITNYNGVSGAESSVRVGFYNGSWHVTSPASPLIPTIGEWYHVVGTYDGTYLKQYNNGVYASVVTVGAVSGSGNGTVRVGRRWDGDTSSKYFFPGDVGVVRIYNGALTADQVTENFNQERARFGI